MNDIRGLIQEQIDAREKDITGFEAAIIDAREFVARLRQALALINGDVAVDYTAAPIPHDQSTPIPEAVVQPDTILGVESQHPVRSSARDGQRVTRTQSESSRKERCGCGRPRSHYGRCAHRREMASASREHKASPRGKSAAAVDRELKPIRSHDIEPQKPKEIRQAVARPDKRHSCGQCVTRYVDGTPFFSAQPNCPEHGLGYGTAQPGREQRAAPPIVN
jgi:hypothetical protein